MNSDQDIVITGISGRYPECNNAEEFAEALLKGTNLIIVDDRRYPVGHYDTPAGIGKIPEIDKFDATFFGIHPKQADFMDPRQRILNEVIYESIVDAGYNPNELRGSKTGVYVALSAFQNIEQLRQSKSDGYVNIGISLSMSANRASYCFDFKGPSYAMDAACSGSLYAFVNAVNDMKFGVAESAIVCGAHLVTHPHESSEFNKLTMLAPDSKCKVFSKLRDGYARAEAITCMLLQKKSASRRIYATVLGVGSNIDGYKIEGITYPSSESQFQLMKAIYMQAKINPDDVVFVEAHGTGTYAGDRQELTSIRRMFGNRKNNSLYVGAVKSNMGHSEIASGLCSVSKALIAMESGIIPANLHTDPIDTELPGIKEGVIKIVTENIPWNGGIVGVNSFGFGGCNAHVILKSNPKEKIKKLNKPRHRLVHVSGRTEEAVNYFLDAIEKNQNDDEFLALVDEIHKTNIEGHNFRGYTILGDKPTREIDRSSQARPIWFIYTGMGAQWPGLGRDLMKIEVFRNTINRCAAALKPYNIDLNNILTSTSPDVFDNITNCFSAIAAMEIALTDVLYSLGIVPDNIAGHSMGEVGCSYADGQITPEQAVLLAYARGYACENVKLLAGQMAAVGLSKEECEKLLPDGIFVACQNGKKSVTISGPLETTIAFVEKLSSQGIFAKRVKTANLAYHSKYIADAGPHLYEFAKKVLPDPKPRSRKWISTSVPDHKKHESWTQYCSAEYHCYNFCNPVLFHQIYDHVPKNAIVIEVAPHGLLQAILKREMGPNTTHISLMNRTNDDNESFFLSSIGKIFLSGGEPNLRNLYNDVSFPVSRGTKMIAPLIKWDHSTSWFVPYWKNRDTFGEVVTINISDKEYSYLEGHCADGRVLMPASGYLVLVWGVFAKMHLKTIETFPVVMEKVRFQRATVLPSNEDVKFLINIMNSSGKFEIFEGGSVVAVGIISTPKNVNAEFTNQDNPVIPKNDYLLLSKDDIYKEYLLRRYMYKGIFKGIKECDVFGGRGVIEWKENFICFLDAATHLKITAHPERELQLPVAVEKVIIDPAEHLKQISKQKELPVFYNQALNIIKSGAVEIVGVEVATVPRRQKIQEDPVLETYEFIPYENSISTKLDIQKSIQIALEIVLQNCKGNTKRPRISIVPQMGKRDLVDDIKNILMKQALTDPEYFKYNLNNTHNEKSEIIVITEEVAAEVNVEELLKNLSENGFILYVGDSLKIKKSDLLIVYQAASTESGIYLLRPHHKLPTNYAVVDIRNDDFAWLNKIKKLIQNKINVVYLLNDRETNSGIIGLVKCLLAEPLDVKFISVSIEDTDARVFSMDDEFYYSQLTKGLTINVLRNGRWGTFVHLPLKSLAKRDVADASITILTPGDLSTLSWAQRWSEYVQCDPKSELVHVYYSALNFKDVLMATGKVQLPRNNDPTASEIMIGLEYSGITANGKRVMGIIESEALALQITNDPMLCWDVPESWSLEEAATIPCVYATCYYAMIIRGQMKPGESILIHAGSGGIGISAISIALSMGCPVYTTVGSQEKIDYLQELFPQLRPENIGNSRNASFRRMVMQNTNGKGVNVILNSLSAELYEESQKCIAVSGRFLEIGKVDLFNGTPIDTKMFLKNCSFHGIQLDQIMGCYTDEKLVIKDLVAKGIQSGAVKPLPRTVFDETEVENAFRYLSSGKHKGKVLIRLRNEHHLTSPKRTISAIPRLYFSSSKSYILIGGLGGFGLELTDWLIRKGAKKIVLNSKSNVSTGYQSYCLRRWNRYVDVTVKINLNDTSSIEGAEKLVAEAQKLGPVAGVMNMALVLRDAIIENQTTDMYKEVFKAKIISAQNMDIVTRKLCPDLEHFVAFSSTTSGRGNGGQSNYGMTNSALEKLCEKRKWENLPGLAVQWGPIADVGAVVRYGLQDKSFDKMIAQNIYSCLNVLETFMLQNAPVVASSVLENDAPTIQLSKTPAETVAHILGLKDMDLMDKSTTLSQLGLDSLMMAEIKQSLYRNYQLDFNVNEIRDFTFSKLMELGADGTTQATEPVNKPERTSCTIAKETITILNRNQDDIRTIFFLHFIGGHVEMLRMVAERLKATVYGLQSTAETDYDNLRDYALYFVNQIKNKQPIGPYLLCGYSYGAALAFEIGVELEGNGERVGIIFIDSSPDYVRRTLNDIFIRHEKSADRMETAILAKFSSEFDKLDQDKISKLLENTVGWDAQMQIISELISQETGLDIQEIATSANMFRKRCRAAYFYEPKRILSGKMLLIRREDNEYMPSNDYNLQKICKQRVEVIKLKGDHQSILLEENTVRISEIINNKILQ